MHLAIYVYEYTLHFTLGHVLFHQSHIECYDLVYDAFYTRLLYVLVAKESIA